MSELAGLRGRLRSCLECYTAENGAELIQQPVLDRAPVDRYEAIHRAVAEQKGVKDIDKHIRKLKKTEKWTTFLETDVEQTRKNRESRLGPGA